MRDGQNTQQEKILFLMLQKVLLWPERQEPNGQTIRERDSNIIVNAHDSEKIILVELYTMPTLNKGSFSINLGVVKLGGDLTEDDRQCAWELYT